jgi:hypothetical protein
MWQIAVGQWILEPRAVPKTDVYSFTMHGQPSISTQWLGAGALRQDLCDRGLQRAGDAASIEVACVIATC